MYATENGIKFRFKKRALLLSALGSIGGTIMIAKYLGITIEDVKSMNIRKLIKLIPAYFLSMIVTNHLIARTVRFADPVKGKRVKMVNGSWVKRRSRKRVSKGKSRRSRRSRR